MQPLEQPLHLQIGLGVGELLLRKPLVQPGNAGREPPPPIAVRLEARSKLSRLHHCPKLPRVRDDSRRTLART